MKLCLNKELYNYVVIVQVEEKQETVYSFNFPEW